MDIIDRLIRDRGLYEQIFWKLLDPLVLDEDVSAKKRLLKNVYGRMDVDLVFPDRIKQKSMNNISEILFKFSKEKIVTEWNE